MGVPVTSDGKAIYLPNIFPGGVTLYYAGAGDDPEGSLGEGQEFHAQSNVAGDTVVEWSFSDWVYIAGAIVGYAGAGLGDWASLKLYAPATPVTPNGAGTGNANVVNGVIVPALGDGAYDLDYADAIPVPAYTEDETGKQTPSGYWDWSAPTTGRGDVTPSPTPGQANWHLLAVQQDLARFANRLQLLGDHHTSVTVPAIKPKKVLPHWVWCLSLHNENGSALQIMWTLVTARTRTL